ncbi:alpha/beta hydrolase [Myxococcus stipitatus]|uniref:alpha/beta fold hydrolase n=1 Tax=Myxococcus stipitatus TaxID=83455 RepID=UPI001F3ED473|nr:alpha/beta hydrolase [Myxococcus stipitatus]MCE9670957.1 alpha/beta hydrolase [Myxococcus stipitatus]
MYRRTFLELMAGTFALCVLPGCAGRAGQAGGSSLGVGHAEGPLDAAAYRAERRYLETRFGRIAYLERGTGDAALFLHGFPLNSFQWRGSIERLSPFRRCVAPDFMGLGYTEVAQGQSYAPAEQVAMLVTLLDRLSISTVDLVANDSGGAIAQLFLAHHPDRVRTVLLTNCDVETECPPAAVLPVIEMARKGTYVDQWLAPWLADKVLARSDQGIGGMTYTRPAELSDETIEYYFAPLVRSQRGRDQVHAYTLALEANSLAGIGPALAKSTVPTRILWGTGDTIFSQSSADHLDKAFGNSRGVRRIPGARLFFPEEYPDLIAEEARALWGVR